MAFSFNLIDQPWIPCIRLGGKLDELSLRDTLTQAHTLREIRGDTPLETASLLRLLLVVLHRVFGPKDTAAWRTLWERRDLGLDMPQVNHYLDQTQIYAGFELFGGGRRFYQSRDSRAGEKSVISMALEMASGSNATLFDHHTEDAGIAFSAAQAARSLIVSQNFGFGGLSGLPEKFTDAPCAKGIIFFAEGRSVVETLILNLVRYHEDKPIPQPQNNDLPAWEMADPFESRDIPSGYLDYLTWHNRHIWLVPEDLDGKLSVRYMSWSPGLVMKVKDSDPMKQFVGDRENGYDPLCFRADRALWRDSSLLLRINDDDRPPAVVRWMSDLARRGLIGHEQSYQLRGLGMAKDRASLEFLRAESMPLPLTLLENNEAVGQLSVALELAEKAATRLRMSVFNLARLLVVPNTKEVETDDEHTLAKLGNTHDKSKDEDAKRAGKLARSWNTEERYWAALEPYFHRLITDLPNDLDKAAQAWHDELRRAARNAFDYAEQCVSGDPRAARAIAVASQQFYGRLKSLFPKQTTVQASDTSEESDA